MSCRRVRSRGDGARERSRRVAASSGGPAAALPVQAVRRRPGPSCSCLPAMFLLTDHGRHERRQNEGAAGARTRPSLDRSHHRCAGRRRPRNAYLFDITSSAALLLCSIPTAPGTPPSSIVVATYTAGGTSTAGRVRRQARRPPARARRASGRQRASIWSAAASCRHSHEDCHALVHIPRPEVLCPRSFVF
ncbi:hypothetical protein P154DRAFT_151888 [Amniculicola lignicola CBS 123094]|uniref:Uncharacterized protein n=1 Tax=Amniculicola lignicola CBS 123094 TaxID=1392246 RepID=A0A6A5WPQ7_9PLEO|nr:hypothetical protein P154DRAFT_151888 [Amniculicola lignicola CBS 123094]